MRFLASDVLNGACFAALIVLAGGRTPNIAIGPASGGTAPAQHMIEHSRLHAYAPVDRASGGLSSDPEREVARHAATTTETASTTAGGGPQKSEVLSLSSAAFTAQPAAEAVRKPSGGLGPAADGGPDAHVPPIVRQRPKTPPLTVTAAAKPKEKAKSASDKKAGSKQALGAVTPASVKR